jgi:hypothetical protein
MVGCLGQGHRQCHVRFAPDRKNEQVTITSDDPLPLDSLVSVGTLPKVLGTGVTQIAGSAASLS